MGFYLQTFLKLLICLLINILGVGGWCAPVALLPTNQIWSEPAKGSCCGLHLALLPLPQPALLLNASLIVPCACQQLKLLVIRCVGSETFRDTRNGRTLARNKGLRQTRTAK